MIGSIALWRCDRYAVVELVQYDKRFETQKERESGTLLDAQSRTTDANKKDYRPLPAGSLRAPVAITASGERISSSLAVRLASAALAVPTALIPGNTWQIGCETREI